MDLQHARSSYGTKWVWARTGALILFLVTAILLIASLSNSRSYASDGVLLKAGNGYSVFKSLIKTS
ncbi:hypothetical protein [Hyphomicrobium sulfonivorans]|uniref:hypothetical protein n=1 Tax=Hyphomicrobium sulfonivorans TaxID=121290 RepID=UPI001570CD26|nr:hypothetical protein [Hyphomicrobium sulfonivorans]MBI1650681.1 hypothetical protein [Hyphomicrobium sulfonivorans]NSL71961.1 hypothetical protein [Hyphomicrobium sulfonivorans]